MKKKFALWLSVSGTILLSAVFLIGNGAAAEPASVKVHSPSFDISVIPLYVAKDKGYFAEQGLEPSFVLAAEFDFTASATGASRASAQNIPLKVVLIHTFRPAFWIYARENLSPLQLKGKKLAISSFGGLSHALARLALRKAGLDPDREVVMIAAGTTDMRFAALQSTVVEAAVLNAPGKFKAKKAGLKEVLFLGKHIYALSGGVATTAKWIQTRPEILQRFVTAALKGLKYFLANRDGSIPTMVRYMKVDAAMARELYETTIRTFTEDGMAGEDFMKSEVQLQASVLGLKDVPPFDRPFDLTFARRANQILKP
ncbi:MAG: ABC transporter substrate-binding protein [Deltaproteobacteria bacterium]|nr:ABC transporter substrate-binding protein [Deltaproteobacteria bacterium]